MKILANDGISEAGKIALENAGYQVITDKVEQQNLVRYINDENIEILLVRSATTARAELIDACPLLKLIGRGGVGMDNIDVAYARDKGLTVINTPASSSQSVAELVMGQLFSISRFLHDSYKNMGSGDFNTLKKAYGKGIELRGKTLGLIGYGNIGSQVSVLAEAIGMKVMFYDTETKLPLGNAVPAKNLKELLSVSDIVSLHVPETAQTKNLINKTNLKYCKKGALLLNYARGEVVDLKALAEAIKDGHIGGAGIDVFPVEPEKNGDAFTTPLQGLSNVILTPHIGGSTEEAQQNIGEDVSIKLFQYLERGITNGSHSVPSIALPPVEGAHRILHMHNNVPGVLSAINTHYLKTILILLVNI